ncbi:peptide/nickel transport system ATP-binding protein [Leucobacter exalbidus]|uniref:Peptide/nickel transport system ATP-binding protein n=1 Tax=Leucobacter exalbidus TaxID=662960 RepID=A0A940T652_9MICO|nr:ABC transporter ATP-binding protein [Leucobacter exalbidus]MBP1326641.1 peptide/nickel transport system ATP-binding protein [Leucobacter exalbidus]
MSAQASELLRVSDLTVHAGDTPLVASMSFSVAPGERVGLIGESGSGKSLTSLALTALLPAGLTAAGSVRLTGVETVGASEAALKPLRGAVAAMVFQEPLTALDPLMRVGKQIAEPMRRHLGLRGAALEAAVTAALAEVSLSESRLARAFPHELSGGQRQRVAIAIALAAQPQLLVADEPTTALDVTVQAEVLALLGRLVVERGMGLLFVSHDLAVVSRMTDRVLVLQHGRTVEEGAVLDLLRAPQHPYTAQLVAHARALDTALDGAGAGADAGNAGLGAEADSRSAGAPRAEGGAQ